MFDKPFYHLIFCTPLKVVYAPIPKAACSSVKTYLRDLMGLPKLGRVELVHARYVNGFLYANAIEREDLIKYLFTEKAGFFKFTVCRNPYARLVSAYNDLVAPDGGDQTRGVEAAEALRMTYCRAFDKRPSEVPYLTFERFVRAIAAHDPASLDRHWQLQTTLTCANLLRYDMVIKLEELEKKVDLLARRASLKRAMTLRLNVGGTKVDDLRPYFTDEIKAIVTKVYARDFARFRYDPDDIPGSPEVSLPAMARPADTHPAEQQDGSGETPAVAQPSDQTESATS